MTGATVKYRPMPAKPGLRLVHGGAGEAQAQTDRRKAGKRGRSAGAGLPPVTGPFMEHWHDRFLARKFDNRWASAVQRAFARLLEIHGHPREIALGAALGLFVGMTPLMGIQMAIAIFLAALLKWNKIAAGIGVWITNPLTAPFIYGINYYVGARLITWKSHRPPLPAQFDLDALLSLVHSGPEILLILTVGGLVLGIPLAVVGYCFTLSSIQGYRRRIKSRLSFKTETIKTRWQSKSKQRRNRKKRNRR